MANKAPLLETVKVDAVILKGMAVKHGTDRDHVDLATANTDRCRGVSQGVTAAVEDALEIATPGGGAQFLLGETVSAGDDLVPGAAGKFFKPNNEGDQILGRASEDGVVDDLISGEVYFATAHATQ